MVHVLRNRNEILYFRHFSSLRAVSHISKQQENKLLAVILEIHKRISNMLSPLLCNAILGPKCLHTCNIFIFCLWSGEGPLGRIRVEGIHETTEQSLGLGRATSYGSFNGMGLSS